MDIAMCSRAVFTKSFHSLNMRQLTAHAAFA